MPTTVSILQTHNGWMLLKNRNYAVSSLRSAFLSSISYAWLFLLLSELKSGLSLLSVSEFSLWESASGVPVFLRRLRSWKFVSATRKLQHEVSNTHFLSIYFLRSRIEILKVAYTWNFWEQTSRGIGYSSDSSIRTTWPIFGLFSESGSTHLNAVRRALLRALVDGLLSMFGSTTSSERLLPTIILSHSTKFTYKKDHDLG